MPKSRQLTAASVPTAGRNAALRLALADPKIIGNFEQTDFSAFPEQEQTIAAANSLLHKEIVRWGEVARVNHIEAAQ